MRPNEMALHALRTQVQFELVQVGAEVAQAVTDSRSAQREVTDSKQRCDLTAGEMRAAVQRSPIDLSLLRAMRPLYQADCWELQAVCARLVAAESREQQARDALASLRNRERALERALKAERRKQDLKQKLLDLLHADDMWLQHTWRESSS